MRNRLRVWNSDVKFAGEIRDYNITKKERVLEGDTVLYVSAPDIRKVIEYDIEQEKSFNYAGLRLEQVVSHIAKFVSGLWQIHPFGEGNYERYLLGSSPVKLLKHFAK